MKSIIVSATLGFALGGFFDGILLHQILQWHHLFSLVPGMEDLRTQILWDGYFHAIMYVFAVLGLFGVWRCRQDIGHEPSGRLWGPMIIGFGVWHGIDAILSHWFLGIHRIKIDSSVPLFWDLVWLVAFSLFPIITGIFLANKHGGQGRRSTGVPMIALLLVTAGLGTWALKPPPGMPLTAVVFKENLTQDQVQARLDAAGAIIRWQDEKQRIALVDLARGQGWRLYAEGALMVAGAGLPTGCFSWQQV